MSTIAEALLQRTRLAGVSDTQRLDVEVLLCHVLGQNKTYLYTWPERALSDAQQNQFEQLLSARAEGIPVAYLTETKEFWSLPLKVSPATLIPRPETELLVELALNLFAADSPRQIADLGTGTGAIALAIASERANWQVLGCDRVAETLSLAQANADALRLSNVAFVLSDWCAALPKAEFDLLVSNPPYIAAMDPHLEQGDVRFEPKSALVAGEQGLADIQEIAQQARECLKAGGYLLLEHGWQQASQVQELLQSAGYQQIQTFQDLAGLDRATQCQWPG